MKKLAEFGLWLAHGALALMLSTGLSGCGLLDQAPKFEVCVIYKGKRLCAAKTPDGTWRLSADLTDQERQEVEDILKGTQP